MTITLKIPELAPPPPRRPVLMMSYAHRKTRPRFDYNGRTLEIRSARYTPDLVRTVLDEYVAGGRPSHLSRKHGVPVSTIENWTHNAGVMRDRTEAAINRAVDEGHPSAIALSHRVAAMYRAEESISAICDKLGLYPSQVYRMLEHRRIKPRTKSESVLIAKYGSMSAYIRFVQRACWLVDREGMSKNTAAKRLGVSWPAIDRAIKSKYNPYTESGKERAEAACARMFGADDRISNFAKRGDGLRTHKIPRRMAA